MFSTLGCKPQKKQNMGEQQRNHVLAGRLLGVFHKVRLAEAIRMISILELHQETPNW
jgi:hypothetical protein